MYHHLRSKWKIGLMLVLGLLSLAVIYGCPFSPKDADPNPCPNPPCGEEPLSRKTPQELLEDYFEKTYFARDSILYADMLDEEFQFEFLPADAESLRDYLGGETFWGRTFELKGTGSMFRTQAVTDVRLDIRVQTNNLYLGEGCDGCRELETDVTLQVATTELSDDQTPITFSVRSPQTFVVKKDPSDANQWIIWRQFDRQSIGKNLIGKSLVNKNASG